VAALPDEPDLRPPAQRASDAEREQAVAALRAGAEHGRLTFDELAQRTGLAYDATTGDELVLTAIAILGRAAITVPDGVGVDVSGFALIGGNEHERAPRRSGRARRWSASGRSRFLAGQR
jgi:hypothetical protein